MTRNEHEYYVNINNIAKALDRIANALENNNKEDKTIYYKTRKDMFMDNPCTKEEHDAVNEEYDTKNDELHELVQNLDNERYHEFCNLHCIRSNDAVEVSNYIADLDYDEVLGIIKEIEAANEDDLLISKSDDQANEDAIEFEDGVTYDDDYDLRVTAKVYIAELNSGDFKTKKDAILDYVTNEFGSHGARYTDIIKFAYYLNHADGAQFDSTRDRGYYSLGMSGRNPYLVHGGKDHLVKGINKDGDERYFALSFVESATDYWKYIK